MKTGHPRERNGLHWGTKRSQLLEIPRVLDKAFSIFAPLEDRITYKTTHHQI